MKLAKFVNFTDEIFAHPSLGGHDELCQWGREPYCFPPHTSKIMEDWKAAHFAKHLTNRELLKLPETDKSGNCIGEYHTSPKFPEQDQYFMKIYKQCFVPVEMEETAPEKIKDEVIDNTFKETDKIWCEKCGSKGVRHKKDCPTLSVESNFEGL